MFESCRIRRIQNTQLHNQLHDKIAVINGCLEEKGLTRKTQYDAERHSPYINKGYDGRITIERPVTN